MKKACLAAILLVAFAATTKAQESFAKKDLVGHVGIGVWSFFSDDYWQLKIPPVALSAEYGILDSFIRGKAAIGVGGYLAYTAEKSKIGSTLSRSHVIIGARGVFHYEFVYRLDTYAGLSATYNIVTSSHAGSGTTTSHGSSSGLFPTLFVGARYYFAPRFAAFAELGYGIAPLEIGVAFKF
jgi:hypothetical protein